MRLLTFAATKKGAAPRVGVMLDDRRLVPLAEYTALVALLKRARRWECSGLLVHSDSELMVRQLTGAYKVKSSGLKAFHRRAAAALRELGFPVEILHVPREMNREADRLSVWNDPRGVYAHCFCELK